jgi:hypothetical protein
MRHPLEKIGVLVGLLLTLSWPMLLGAAIAGRVGLEFGALIYVLAGVLFLALVVLGSIRGILGC